MSGFTFNDRIILNDTVTLSTLDSTGVSRSSFLTRIANSTYITAVPGNPLYLNQGITGSTVFINNSGGSTVVVGSKLGVNLTSASLISANLTLPQGAYIGTQSTLGSNSGSLGLTGGYSLDSTSGSRVMLYGNETGGSLALYAGNNTGGSIGFYTGQQSNVLQINNSGSTGGRVH